MARSCASAASAAAALEHPLFASGLAAATHGAFKQAFQGIAALIDEDEQKHSDSEEEEGEQQTAAASASAATQPRPGAIQWTRPTAIERSRLRARVAKEAAAAQITQQSRQERRHKPYTSRRARQAAEASEDAAMEQESTEPNRSGASYGAIRSHPRRNKATFLRQSRSSVRNSAAREETASAGEATMLLNMWKM